MDVAGGFADFCFVGVDVEADFAGAGGHEHWVAFFGFLEERVGGCGHGHGDDALFLRLALVEGQVQRAKGFFFAVDFYYAVGEGIDDFGTEDRAIDNEVA